MADRSSEESVPEPTGARSATTRKTARAPRTSGAGSAAPAGTTQRKSTQARKTSAKTSGTGPGKERTGATVAKDETADTPPPATAAPPDSPTTAAAPEASTAAPPHEAPPLTDRINAAYASSGPVLTDDAPGTAPVAGAGVSAPTGDRPTGAERFAAAVAGSKAGKQRPTSTRSGEQRRTRKARLRLTHVDSWSVMKTAFLLAVAIGIVTVVAVAVVWSVLDAAGVWGSIDKAVGDVVGQSSDTFRIEDYLGLSRVLGFTLVVAVVDVVLITVIATLGAFLYNLAAALLGGIEVVLAEEDH